MIEKVNIFISYCHRDEGFKDQLMGAMAPLKETTNITPWEDRKLLAGQDWNTEIRKQLRNAHVVLLLLSPDFLASRYCREVETKVALEMHKKLETIVVPVFLRPCYLNNSNLLSINGLPKDKSWVTLLPNTDEAFLEIVKGLDRVIKAVHANQHEKRQKKLLKEQVNSINKRKKIYVSFVPDELEEQRERFCNELQGAIDYKDWPFEICPSAKEKIDFNVLADQSKTDFLNHYLKEAAFSIHFASHLTPGNQDLFTTQFLSAENEAKHSSLKCILGYDPNASILSNLTEKIKNNQNVIGISNWNEHLIMETISTEMDHNDSLKKQYNFQVKRLEIPEKKVFLLHENIDGSSRLRKKLRSLLKRNKLIVLQNIATDFQYDDFDPKKYEEEQFQMCNGAIILYGKASENWCLLKQHKIRKMNIPAKGICFDDPDKDDKIDAVGCGDFLSLNEQNNLERDIELFASQLNTFG